MRMESHGGMILIRENGKFIRKPVPMPLVQQKPYMD
jgi:hypothetical protein